MKNIVLMASGTGTNAINLINYSKKLYKINICGIIIDKKTSGLFQMNLDVPIFYIPKKKQDTIEVHELKIMKKTSELKAEYIILCGYMRILSHVFVNKYSNKIFNIHPSLLPKFKGANAYFEAFLSNENTSGVTVHYVSEELDSGEILFQQTFLKHKNDTLEEFIQRGKEVEWELYPKVLLMLENL